MTFDAQSGDRNERDTRPRRIDRRAFPHAALAGTTLLAGLLLASGPARAQPWPADRASCTVTFDNHFALTNVIGQARATFASMTGMSTTGAVAACNPAVHSACWDLNPYSFRNQILSQSCQAAPGGKWRNGGHFDRRGDAWPALR